MDFTFRSFKSNNFGSSSIETAGSLASTQTVETAGSLAWVAGDNAQVDQFSSSNPFAPQIDYSQYTATETTGSLANSGETAGSLASVMSGASFGGDFGGASVGGDFGGSVSGGGSFGGGAVSCGGGSFSSVC